MGIGIAGVLLIAGIEYLGEYHLIMLIPGLALFGLCHALVAKPIPYTVEEKFCQECGRLDVGYYRAGDKICADCIDAKRANS